MPPKKSRALLIGLNYANVDGETVLTGCVNDVRRMAAYLQGVMGEDIDVTVITDEDPDMQDRVSWSGIFVSLMDMCVKSWSDDLDSVVFHYSGHGRQARELRSGGYIDQPGEVVEDDGLDEGIVPVDYDRYGIVRDDVLNAIFTRFNPRTRVLCVFDCCHSGSILDLPYQYGLHGLVGPHGLVDHRPPGAAVEGPWIVCLSAGRDVDIAGEIHGESLRRGDRGSGAFTTYLLDELLQWDTDQQHDILSTQMRINDRLDLHEYDQIHTVSSSRPLAQVSIRWPFEHVV